MSFANEIVEGDVEYATNINENTVVLAVVPTPGTFLTPCFESDQIDMSNRGDLVAKATFSFPIVSLRVGSKEVEGGTGKPVRYYLVTVPKETEQALFAEGRGVRPVEDVRPLPNHRPHFQTAGVWQRAVKGASSGARRDGQLEWVEDAYDLMVCHEDSVMFLPGLQHLPWVQLPRNTFEATFIVDQPNRVEVGVPSFRNMAGGVAAWSMGVKDPKTPALKKEWGYYTTGSGALDPAWHLTHMGTTVVTTPVPGVRGARRDIASGFAMQVRFEWKGDSEMGDAQRDLFLPTSVLCPMDLRIKPGTRVVEESCLDPRSFKEVRGKWFGAAVKRGAPVWVRTPDAVEQRHMYAVGGSAACKGVPQVQTVREATKAGPGGKGGHRGQQFGAAKGQQRTERVEEVTSTEARWVAECWQSVLTTHLGPNQVPVCARAAARMQVKGGHETAGLGPPAKRGDPFRTHATVKATVCQGAKPGDPPPCGREPCVSVHLEAAAHARQQRKPAQAPQSPSPPRKRRGEERDEESVFGKLSKTEVHVKSKYARSDSSYAFSGPQVESAAPPTPVPRELPGQCVASSANGQQLTDDDGVHPRQRWQEVPVTRPNVLGNPFSLPKGASKELRSRVVGAHVVWMQQLAPHAAPISTEVLAAQVGVQVAEKFTPNLAEVRQKMESIREAVLKGERIALKCVCHPEDACHARYLAMLVNKAPEAEAVAKEAEKWHANLIAMKLAADLEKSMIQSKPSAEGAGVDEAADMDTEAKPAPAEEVAAAPTPAGVA